MNKQTEQRINEIRNELERRGFVRTARAPWNGGACYTLPSKRRETYLGTYLNSFGLDDPSGRPELWSDEIALEYPELTVSPVYRHNGADEDVSVEIVFNAWHTDIRVWPEKWKYNSKNPVYVAKVIGQAPYNYLEDPEPLLVNTYGTGGRVAKLAKTAGKKAVANAVSKAVSMCEEFEPRDLSAFAKDRKMYHADTRTEMLEWDKAHRQLEPA